MPDMLDDFDPAMVERLQTIAFNLVAFSDRGALTQQDIKAILRALPLSVAALNALEAGEAVVVPKARTREMLDARQMVHGFAPLPDNRWRDIESARAGIDCDDASIIDEEWRAQLAASPYTETKDG